MYVHRSENTLSKSGCVLPDREMHSPIWKYIFQIGKIWKWIFRSGNPFSKSGNLFFGFSDLETHPRISDKKQAFSEKKQGESENTFSDLENAFPDRKIHFQNFPIWKRYFQIGECIFRSVHVQAPICECIPRRDPAHPPIGESCSRSVGVHAGLPSHRITYHLVSSRLGSLRGMCLVSASINAPIWDCPNTNSAHGMICHGMACTAWHGTALHGMAWHNMAWHGGMPWHAVACHGMP